MSDTSNELPPVAAIITHPVADFDTWKSGFDDHEGARRAAGIVGHHINRAVDDPNPVTVFLPGQDHARMEAFSTSDELRTKMEELGVTGPPTIMWVQPIREDIVWDRQLPAAIVSHTVADFDVWLDGYDASNAFRSQGGIIGQAVNRSLDDPSLVVIYHQAETFDDLRAFIGSEDLAARMKEIGVTSAPDISYYNGGWGKFYD